LDAEVAQRVEKLGDSEEAKVEEEAVEKAE